MRTPDRLTLSCSSCAKCPTEDCPAKKETEEPRLRGRSLGLVAIGVFIAPVALAIVGGLCASGSDGAQFAGTLTGLGLGLGASAVLARFILRPRREGTSPTAARASRGMIEPSDDYGRS